MAQQSSIVFSPELDERQLDRETGKVNDELQQVGQDVPVNFDSEGLDGLGGGIGGDAGGGIGGAAMGRGAGAGAAAGLASKIPKPVAGITAASAMPIALAGTVGAGLLSAMHSASAAMQTDSKLMGIAVKNFFREPGNILSEHITRPLAKDLLDLSTEFDKSLRQGDTGEAGGLLGGASLQFGAETFGSVVGGRFGKELGSLPWGDIFRAAIDDFSWPSLPDFKWPSLPKFNWPSLPRFNWPSLPDFSWPNVGMPSWPSAQQILNQFPTINASSLRSAILGGGGGTGGVSQARRDLLREHGMTAPRGGTGGDDGGGLFGGLGPIAVPGMPGIATGGRITGSGVAQVHRGEIVADRERLVSELADAIGGMGGGGGGGMDTRNMERKLDQLNRNVKRLREALDVTLTVDGETLARTTQNARMNRSSDTDPTI